MTTESFDLGKLRLPPGHEKWATVPAKNRKRPHEKWAEVPAKIRKRRKQFSKFPLGWRERLCGAAGQTVLLAVDLLYLHWRGKGGPIKLANGMPEIYGIDRRAKWRALGDLERRGLIVVERRPRRSPIVRIVV
jgi:hypothetical protein